MSLLTVSGICRSVKGSLIVKDVFFTQEYQQKIAIAGATGSGKTTLLKMIAGLIQPSSGNILFEGKKVAGPLDQLLPGHYGIAFLSQHFELRNNYWVREILDLYNKLPETEAQMIYTICQVEHLFDHRTDAISGGERQRIALAGLLTTNPRLLLLDEPFSNLDMLHKNVIKSVIEDIGIKLNISCIMVSHDALDILPWADRILVMNNGVIIQDGTPEQVYHQPVNEYAAGLFGAYNLIDTQFSTNLNKMTTDGTSAIVRPEQLTIVSEGNHQLSGILKSKLFCGSYYTLQVLMNEQIITVKTTDSVAFNLGDLIYLSLSSNQKIA